MRIELAHHGVRMAEEDEVGAPLLGEAAAAAERRKAARIAALWRMVRMDCLKGRGGWVGGGIRGIRVVNR
jgi:hypothetical protein